MHQWVSAYLGSRLVTPNGCSFSIHTVLHKGANFALPDLPNDTDRHLTGVSHLLLQNEIPWASTLAYLEHAHARGIVTIFNPSPMPASTQLHAFPWAALSWLIVNEDEADSLHRVIGGNPGNRKVEEYPVNWPDDNNLWLAFATLNHLRHGGHLTSTSVVCTLGAAGVMASICGLKDVLYLPAATLEGDVRDTTGAGDCLTGYFVAGLMESGNKQLSEDEAARLLRLCVQVCPTVPTTKKTISHNILGGRHVCRKERCDGIHSRACRRRCSVISKINVTCWACVHVAFLDRVESRGHIPEVVGSTCSLLAILDLLLRVPLCLGSLAAEHRMSFRPSTDHLGHFQILN